MIAASDPTRRYPARARASSTRRPSAWTSTPACRSTPPCSQPRHWVADIVYFPAETELLRRARAIGCRTLAGTGMAIFQAVQAFELFTGLAPDRDAMAQHFEAAA